MLLYLIFLFLIAAGEFRLLDVLTFMSESYDPYPTKEHIEDAQRFLASLHGQDAAENPRMLFLMADYKDNSNAGAVANGPRHNVSVIAGDKVTDHLGRGMHLHYVFEETGDLHTFPGTSTKGKWKRRDPAKTRASIERSVARRRAMGSIEWSRVCLVSEFETFEDALEDGLLKERRNGTKGKKLSNRQALEADYFHAVEVKGDWNLKHGVDGEFCI